ncbi:peroxynitrite isomerase THAP4-like [Lycodopsis pacificus]
MPSCVAFNCVMRSDRSGSKVPLFRFPRHHEARLRLWVANVKRKNWEPSANSRLCALHFTTECFHSAPGRRRRLNATAVPTVFTFSRHAGNRTRTSQEERVLSGVSDPVYLDHPYCGAAASDPSTSGEVPSTEASGAANAERRHETAEREGDRVGEESRVGGPASAEHAGVGDAPDTQMALKKLHVQTMGRKLVSCRKELKSERQKTRRLNLKTSRLTGVVRTRQNTQKTSSCPLRTSDGEAV